MKNTTYLANRQEPDFSSCFQLTAAPATLYPPGGQTVAIGSADPCRDSHAGNAEQCERLQSRLAALERRCDKLTSLLLSVLDHVSDLDAQSADVHRFLGLERWESEPTPVAVRRPLPEGLR